MVFVNRPEPPKPQEEEGKIANEIECLKKMAMVYEKEIDALRGKLRMKAGPERVVELEKKIAETQKKQDEMVKKIKDMEKKVKDLDKVFEKEHGVKESGSEKYEEQRLLKTINKEYEKAEAFEAKMKQNNDAILIREEKIQQANTTIQKLEDGIEQLKREAAAGATQKNSSKETLNSGLDKEKLKLAIKEVQGQIDAEAGRSKKELQEQQVIIMELKGKLKELEQVNRVNSHKILEYTRMTKLSKSKALLGKAPKSATDKQKRSEKMQKYKRMKLKKAAVELAIQTVGS